MVGIDDPSGCTSRRSEVPLLNAEEEVVLAKAIELGEQIVGGTSRSGPSWRSGNGPRPTPRRRRAPRFPQHQLPYKKEVGPHRPRRLRRGRWRTGSCQGRPTVTKELNKRPAGQSPPEPTKAHNSSEAKGFLTAWDQKEPTGPDRFRHSGGLLLHALVHSGDLEARDNPGLRALYDWTQATSHMRRSSAGS